MRIILLFSALWLGCNGGTTQLEVIVEAEREVALRSSRVLFEVTTQEGDVALSERFDPDETPFPIRRLIAPRSGDASRVVTLTAQAVDANGQLLTTSRLIRAFVEGRTTTARLRLYDLCLGTNCPEGLTCEPIQGRAECVDARVMDNPTDAGVDADASSCPDGQLLCNDQCIDSQSDESHCGTCGNGCSSDQLCSSGTCEVVPCDGPAGCAQGSYCNLNMGRCLSGCDEPSDCGDNSSCDQLSNQCECAAGFHRCSAGCVPNNTVGSCGDRCSPCESLSNGTSSCQTSADTFVCAAMCNDGFNLCNGSCALASSPASCGPSCTVCPGSSRGTAICNAGSCSLSCNLGTTMCPVAGGLDCVDTTSNANHCGTCGRVCTGGQICQNSDCIEPPNCDVNNPASCGGLTYCNPANNRCASGCDPRLSNQCGSNQTCTGNQCVCTSGTHDCSGVCLSNSSVNSCGVSCTSCALRPNATQMGCNGSSCIVQSCASGYQVSSDQQSCEDINECLTTNGGCHANATCTNTPVGSRTCSCNMGFSGNGTTCAPIVLTDWEVDAFIKASDPGYADLFGSTVAVSADGNTLAVGAFSEDSHLGGQSFQDSGAVYVFIRTGSVWSQQAYLKASNTGAGDQFGRSISLSADGNTLAVGAIYEDSSVSGINGAPNEGRSDSGAAYVFVRTNTTWSQQAFIKSSNPSYSDTFGSSIALSADGNTLAVGASNEDSSSTGIDPSSNDGAPSSGAMYVFVRVNAAWTQQAFIKASNTSADDYFGGTVSLSGDGNTLAVGAHREDDGHTDTGAVYVFSRTGSTWRQETILRSANRGASDILGVSLSLSLDGNTLAAGAREDSSVAGVNGSPNELATDSGAVYVFTRAGTIWTQQAFIKASNPQAQDLFGDVSLSLSADGNVLAVGADGEDSSATGVGGTPNEQTSRSGAVYVFTRVDSTWTQQAFVKATNTDVDDQFGGSVCLSADASVLAVGAVGEDTSVGGVNQPPNENQPISGAVYTYSRN